MANDDWQSVRKIFDSALRRPPAERPAFVAEECGSDIHLLAEVESLLSSLGNADSFLETPAVAELADTIRGTGRIPEIGSLLAHYEIVNPIAAGGMGTVYLAQDRKLDRPVALKILNEEFSEDGSDVRRFMQEARAASALNHPNILVIHEFGTFEETHFIVSEFIEGKTLRETLNEKSLNLTTALDVSIQIAKALSAAHKASLIHRDVKPENVMIRPDGVVKVLDFGLAKLVEGKNRSFLGSDTSIFGNQTANGAIRGTVNYMSPEQAKGERVDERSDIFSLGVLIYELIAGRPPFAGGSMPETFANLMNSDPDPLPPGIGNLPDEMARIVSKALKKRRDERYQTMDRLLADLENLKETLRFEEKTKQAASPTATEEVPATSSNAVRSTIETFRGISRQMIRTKPLTASILLICLAGAFGVGSYFRYSGRTSADANGRKTVAVLPLKAVGSTSRDVLYEIGIAESLIHRLGSVKGVVVRPISATRRYADIDGDTLGAAKEQQVDYVVAANYLLAGGKIRVTAQLINVANGDVEVNYQSSERDADNVFATQDAIAGELGNLVIATFGNTDRGPSPDRGTTNEEAYRLYVQGMIFYDQRDAARAVKTLDQAVTLDPGYALAWAGKAHAHRIGAWAPAYFDGGEEYLKSIDAARKSLALNPNLSQGYSALCENEFAYEYDFAKAERDCRRALELDPDSAMAHNIFSFFLTGRGRHDEAIREIKTAIDLEPTSFYNQRIYANALYFARRFDEAVSQYKRLIELDKEAAPSYQWLIRTLEMQGNESEAFQWLVVSMQVAKRDETTIRLIKAVFRKSGWSGILRERELDSSDYSANYFRRAGWSARIGEKDKAFEYLEKSLQRRDGLMNILEVEPEFDQLHDDPRFAELVRRLVPR